MPRCERNEDVKFHKWAGIERSRDSGSKVMVVGHGGTRRHFKSLV
jgi:hypothetical protein